MPSRELIVALVGVVLLFPLTAGMDQRRPARPDVLATLPPEQLLPLLAFGQRESAADILEVRAVGFLSDRLDRFLTMDGDHLWALYSAIVALDPQSAGACYRGSMFISSVANRPGAAIQMLSMSLGEEDPDYPFPEGSLLRVPVHPEHPRRWLLYHEQASVYFLMLRARVDDPEQREALTRRAGELWLLAGSQPSAPQSLMNVGRKLQGSGLTPLQGFEQERLLWEQRSTSGDVLQREKARARLAEATCGRNREALQQVYDTVVGRGKTVDDLSKLPIRLEYLEDPLGVGFLLSAGKVVAPAYEAARLELQLADTFWSWRKAHPGEIPTEEDFPTVKSKLRPYLRMTVAPEGLRIQGFLPK